MTALRWLPVRVLPVPVIAAYLVSQHGLVPATSLDWLLGMTAAVVTGVGVLAPLTATVVQSGLLLAVPNTQAAMPMVFLMAMITLGELWIRRDGLPCLVGTAVSVAAQLWLYAPHLHPLLTPMSLLVTTAPPVLLGMYIRSVLRVALAADRRREEAVLAARVAERTAIARELHDLVAHHLASIAVQVGAARHSLRGADAGVDAALAQAHTTTRAGLADLRRLMTVLRDPTSTGEAPGAAMADAGGLPTALAAVVERTRAAGVAVDATIDPQVADLDSIRRLAVLRVVQEGLTNVVKHAGPRAEATVSVHTGDTVRIVVADNGAASRRTDRGFGLVGMRERVELLGGAVSVAAHDGWHLTVTIPAGTDR
ncbi:sensor histidine kinase [Actinophytocola oryzae]|uniref:histidine kinase n=1 Tax=Actinophytocola oryzae TaxID=502181 RepID=A0A4R7VXJ2_9PSEU|nr:histidine kinase [Actinophytocola oryzae]TDV53927.1 signal transduction histidine kinase [Actinophytocola oryzae]